MNRVLSIDARTEDGESIVFETSSYGSERAKYTIPKEGVDKLMGYGGSLIEEPVRIRSNRSCEFLLRDSSKMMARGIDDAEYHDPDNQITYSLSRASFRMLMELLIYADNGHSDMASELRSRLRRSYAEKEGDGLHVLSAALPYRCLSLLIKLDDDNPNDKVDYVSLCNSFCFLYAYNLGDSILPINSLDELTDRAIRRRIRRSSKEDMEPPRRKYLGELVYFYTRGISGESWDYQYLSYYHVLEYFFEKVYSDNMVAKMRQELTRPGFSYKRDKDLLAFEKTMRKTFKDFTTASGVNESEALILTLKKYIPDLTKLKDSLDAVSSTIVDYIKTTDSPFSSSKINLDLTDADGVYTSLANRIYATRNAIAHSKETLTKKKFVPFKHDAALVNEVLLIRVVSEEVIINSSKEL
ncbi:MAG: hypothetical protein IJ628_11230 [Bacteroidaceae bacterium]|nr:hypothetical protein [Bacteroidaceae bacterium]